MAGYTLSQRAHNHLIELFARKPSKPTVWRRGPVFEYDGFGSTTNVNPVRPKYEGVGWALTCIARSFGYQDWAPKPDKQTHLYYNPLDQTYLDQVQQDLKNDPDSLSNNEQLDYEAELLNTRHQYGLSLDQSTRFYYSNLLTYLHIELPTRPSLASPRIAPVRNSLTTRVSFCLEAIGTGHILPPPGYQLAIQEPNHRKDPTKATRLASLIQSVGTDEQKAKYAKRIYGNLSHTSYEQKEWRRLPSKVSNFTQADVDYCCQPHVRLEDLAQEACTLNPSLTYQPKRDVPSIPITNKDDRELYHRQSATQPTATQSTSLHTYRGIDITEAVLKVYDLHYNQGKPFTVAHQIVQVEYPTIPYNQLRQLAAREHATRLMQASAPLPLPTATKAATSRQKIQEALS